MMSDSIRWLQLASAHFGLDTVPCNWHPDIETGGKQECGKPAEFLAVIRTHSGRSAMGGWDALPLCAEHYGDARYLAHQRHEVQQQQQGQEEQPVLRAVVSYYCDRGDCLHCNALSGCMCSCHTSQAGGDA